MEGLLIIALCVMAYAWAYERTGRPRHQDPCLHHQGLHPWDTWKAADPGLFRKRFGKALEWHLGGVPWDQAARPDQRHDCKPQTCGITETLQHYDRCPCGATRYGVWGKWERRNTWQPSSL